MSLATRRQSTSDANDKSQLEEKCRRLENEVRQLKRRLDELRQAKNTTLIKNETRVLKVKPPNLGIINSNTDSSVTDVNQIRRDELIIKLRKEIEDLRRQLVEKDTNNISVPHVDDVNCNHQPILESLEAENVCLQFQLEERIAESQFLRDELGRKEAAWCEAEERYKKDHDNLLAAFNRLQTIVTRVQADLPGIQQATEYLQDNISRNNPNNRRGSQNN